MDTVQIGNHLSMVRGTHNIKIGGEVYYITMERGAANLEEGRYAFSANQSGYAFASYLLGYPNSTESAEGLPLTFPRATRFGAYAFMTIGRCPRASRSTPDCVSITTASRWIPSGSGAR